MVSKVAIAVSLFALSLLLSACGTTPQPSNINNVCEIFIENPKWYRATKRSVARWGGNLHVPMAIIYQESSFKAKVKPKRKRFLGIPTTRPSDAYGYAQALKSTWASYKAATDNRWANRDNFTDAVDFVLWYMDQSYKRNAVSKWDARAQYLNYHEGQGGYSRGTHLSKTWLLNTADRVQSRASRFAQQLNSCAARLDKRR